MKIIGLTGSIAMGKSEVAKIFAQHGVPVFDSDVEVHKLYDSKQGAELIRPFVPEAAVDNKVDRKIITQHVLRDPSLLAKLEKDVHAEIKRRRDAFLAEAKNRGETLVVLDMPLLFETGANKDVDVTIAVSSAPELQHARALARPGMTEERLRLILAKQMPDAKKRLKSNYIIENNSTLLELTKQTEIILMKLKAK